ncbi:TetR/AcrR family transcriptional regulator [Streptomyces gibsoniae]|uniref:TetR/AcrR family transcriptional regulator n=1 Tax=Streptomyces gibsoniae TaxID=3075529 RepID=A0ABU2U4S0_9ACTN|nr:TetR/AcrR family transcriptional regulator [Streptomyces sp. DSM 41699]MDT0468163.1 TetR/AcrR family transcriptional regulator [Streptomyces sp. DSM 41699]
MKLSRPRTFVEAQALQNALFAFWKYGYEGASLNVLTEVTGMGRTSLYRTFGSKEELFRRALELYRSDYLDFRVAALAETTPRRIAEKLLYGLATLHTGETTPPGCLETNAALACGPDNDVIREELARNRDQIGPALRQRLRETSANGALPRGLDADATATLLLTLIQGMAVQAKGGHSRADLEATVRATLSLWEGPEETGEPAYSAPPAL